MFTILEVKVEKFLKHKNTLLANSDDLIPYHTASDKTLSYTFRRIRVEKASDILLL